MFTTCTVLCELYSTALYLRFVQSQQAKHEPELGVDALGDVEDPVPLPPGRIDDREHRLPRVDRLPGGPEQLHRHLLLLLCVQAGVSQGEDHRLWDQMPEMAIAALEDSKGWGWHRYPPLPHFPDEFQIVPGRGGAQGCLEPSLDIEFEEELLPQLNTFLHNMPVTFDHLLTFIGFILVLDIFATDHPQTKVVLPDFLHGSQVFSTAVLGTTPRKKTG